MACVQVCAEDDVARNISEAVQLSRQAIDAGAQLVCLPENFTCLEERDSLYAERGFPAEQHPALPVFRSLAQETSTFFSLGSLTVKLTDGRVANRCYVIGPNGGVLAEYDKIHLFDVRLRNGEYYRESSTVAAGECASLVSLPWGKMGLSICYDVRFPYLYRALARAGADFLSVPAAFTHTTGEAHWHVLLRARAIETGCFVFAAAQCGTRRWGRRTYGHSLIIDPWGEVLADAGTLPGFVIADIDPAKVAETRAMIPSLSHEREIGMPG